MDENRPFHLCRAGRKPRGAKLSECAASAPPHKLDAFQKREALARLESGESQSLIARTYSVDRATISRLARR